MCDDYQVMWVEICLPRGLVHWEKWQMNDHRSHPKKAEDLNSTNKRPSVEEIWSNPNRRLAPAPLMRHTRRAGKNPIWLHWRLRFLLGLVWALARCFIANLSSCSFNVAYGVPWGHANVAVLANQAGGSVILSNMFQASKKISKKQWCLKI